MRKRVWIDTETTGLWHNKDKIVELALIYQEDGKPDDVYHVYIRHDSYPEKYSEACALHGLSPEILEEKGISEKEAYEGAKKFLGSHINSFDTKDKAVLCGFNVKFDNVKFDNDFIRSMFKGFGDKFFGSYFTRINFCVMGKCAEALVKELLPLLPNFKLKTIAEYFKIKHDAHSALDDIKVTMKVNSMLDMLLGGTNGKV